MIGYYVHHHGHGHLARASTVAAASAEPVVALSSLPRPAEHPFADWVALPPDPPMPTALDPTAGGLLHWAPLDGSGYRARMRALATWATSADPRLVVVDVSVEVTLLLRLLGVRVVVVAMPGDRADRPHEAALDAATRVLAPWPREVHDPGFLRAAGAKVTFTGAFSRFDDRCAGEPPRRRRALLILGSGGGTMTATQVDDITRMSGWECSGFGGADLPWTPDVWSQLQRADVVVAHAGLNVVAEIAASRRAAVLLPQHRPFDEQRHTADALARAGIADVADPEAVDWSATFERAATRGGQGWGRWNDGHGVERFLSALSDIA